MSSSSFLVNQSHVRYKVLKNGQQLFDSDFVRIILTPGVVVFVRDLLSESVVLTPTTIINLSKGSTKVTIVADATGDVYQIEAVHEAIAEALIDQIKIAAGQLEGKVNDEDYGRSALAWSIQQLTNLLACLQRTDNTPALATNIISELRMMPNMVENVKHDRTESEPEVDQVKQLPAPGVSASATGLSTNSSSTLASSGTPKCPKPRSTRKSPGYLYKYRRELFVYNLPVVVTKQELEAIFKVHGTIEMISIVSHTGRQNTAFITYKVESSVDAALKNGSSVSLKLLNGYTTFLGIRRVIPGSPGRAGCTGPLN